MEQLKLNDLNLPLAVLMRQWPATISVFARHKMLCMGCMVGPFHTALDACAEYGLEVDALYAELSESVTQAQ